VTVSSRSSDYLRGRDWAVDPVVAQQGPYSGRCRTMAFSVPVLAAGVATTHFGLHRTAVVYSAALAVLAAAAAGSLIIRSRSRVGSPPTGWCA
jgi:hypothetical protein